MRVVTVHPGPDWSVADCHRGWSRAFKALGCQVVEFDTGRRLEFYEAAKFERDDGALVPAVATDADRAKVVSKHLESVLYEVWPDIVFVTYGACIDPATLQLARERGHVVVLYHTESPYEDDSRLKWAESGVADIWLINDPTNLEKWRQACPTTWYLPHSYDPDIHRPGKVARKTHDVTFVGSSFPSRVEWFTRFVETAPDLNLLLAGQWQTVGPGHPLEQACPHSFAECLDNVDVPPLYWQSKVGLNIYRRESERPDLADGWSMGPREVEMAACGLFHLTEERGENRQVLPMLPTFESPEDAAEQARWWARHPDARDRTAEQARAAVGAWTFRNRAAQVLRFIYRLSAAA